MSSLHLKRHPASILHISHPTTCQDLTSVSFLLPSQFKGQGYISVALSYLYIYITNKPNPPLFKNLHPSSQMFPSNNSDIILSLGIKPEIPAVILKEQLGQLHRTFVLCHTWEADRWHHRMGTAITPCVQRGKLSQYLWSETLASANWHEKPIHSSSQIRVHLILCKSHTGVWNR